MLDVNNVASVVITYRYIKNKEIPWKSHIEIENLSPYLSPCVIERDMLFDLSCISGSSKDKATYTFEFCGVYNKSIDGQNGRRRKGLTIIQYKIESTMVKEPWLITHP